MFITFIAFCAHMTKGGKSVSRVVSFILNQLTISVCEKVEKKEVTTVTDIQTHAWMTE